MASNNVIRGFLDKTVSAIDIEVLKNCKGTKKLNGTITFKIQSITFTLYQNKFIIVHDYYIKELAINPIDENLRIKFNHIIEASLAFKEIKDKNDFFNYMVQQDTAFTFDDIEKIRDIISVLIEKFYSVWWK